MTRRNKVISHCVVWFLASHFGCTQELAPRSQLVVVVDTDAHLLDELPTHSEISPASAIDTLRIDVLDDLDQSTSQHTFGVASRTRWPLSFGVVSARLDAPTRLRFRLFRAQDAIDEQGALSPYREIAVDRLVVVGPQTRGVSHVRVTLRFDCFGRPVGFDGDGVTCIDAARLTSDPRVGIDAIDDDTNMSATIAGTWPGAIEQPCLDADEPDRVCIPGGFTILGAQFAVGLESDTRNVPFPLHPALLSAFRMDRFEYTVGRFRALVRAGRFTGKMPFSGTQGLAAGEQQCTWIDPDDDSHDTRPLNCISIESAASACESDGGSLPSEAQWEYAARGRGELRPYPWGEAVPTCCAVAAQRGPDIAPRCDDAGLEPVGSHVGADCGGVGDVSRDGVVDLAGSLGEAMRDLHASYSDPCWAQPLPLDPVCVDAATMNHTRRGAHWDMAVRDTYSALRGQYVGDFDHGFRCVYPAVTQ